MRSKPQLLLLKVEGFTVFIKINNNNSSSTLAFAEINFLDEKGEECFKIKGFRIMKKVFSGKPTTTVEFPAYPSGGGRYYKSFIAEGDNYKFIIDAILKQYKFETSEKPFTSEEIDDLL